MICAAWAGQGSSCNGRGRGPAADLLFLLLGRVALMAHASCDTCCTAVPYAAAMCLDMLVGPSAGTNSVISTHECSHGLTLD